MDIRSGHPCVPPGATGLRDGDEQRACGAEPKWPLVALVLIGAAPTNIALTLPRPVLSAMAADLGRGPGGDLLVKLVIAIIGPAVVLGAPLAGFIVRRIGLRLGMAGALALFVVAGSLPFLLNDLLSIVVSRFFLGLSVAGIQVSAITLAGEAYGAEQRPRMVGFMFAIASFTALVMGPLAGVTGEFGWRIPFLWHFLIAPFVVIALLGLPSRSPGASLTAQAVEAPLPFRDLPFFLIAMGFIGGAVICLPPLYLAFRLRQIGITSPTLIGASFIIINIPEMLSASFYGYFRNRLPRALLCAIGFAFATLGLGLIAMTTSYRVTLCGMALYGPAVALIYASLMDAAADERQPARVAALVISAIFVSLIVGIFALEPIAQRVGPGGTLALLATLSLTAMIALLARFVMRRSALLPQLAWLHKH
jgi:predicted MFS family arabinose efflux permease